MTALTPVIVDNCDRTIMAPMPQENPVTTGCGTFWICRPRRSSENVIMKMEATIQTFAAPPGPCSCTACAMKGTVALAVPPINTGFRPRRAVMGALTMDVTSPKTAGSPIMVAIARP